MLENFHEVSHYDNAANTHYSFLNIYVIKNKVALWVNKKCLFFLKLCIDKWNEIVYNIKAVENDTATSKSFGV